MFKKEKKSHRLRSAVFFVIIFILAAFGIYFMLNTTEVLDRVAALSYRETPEMTAIEDKLLLTDRAKLMFRASRPALETRELFNSHCDSHDEAISILGCYASNQIYLYNIDDKELSGVVESTAAHELLHAAWDRLSESEIAKITPLIQQVYKENEDLLSEDLKNYSDADKLEELHSRVGVEIAKLPSELETYYAKYFTDQDKVVSFYDSYIEPFNKLADEIEVLESEMEEISSQISKLETEYKNYAENLNQEISAFNMCASTAGCFGSQADFTRRRNELIIKQNNADELYNQLSSFIEKYNEKVIEYNQNVLRSQNLESAINSNYKSEIIEKE